MVTRDGSGGLRSNIRQTHTYAVLEVAPETFADVRRRLEAVDSLGDYLALDGIPPAEVIIFGGVALKAEVKK